MTIHRIYTFDDSEVKMIALPNEEIKANAYGPRHHFEDSKELTFYWFEYVPYKGLIRVHGGNAEERNDYYLRYTDGSFVLELETKSLDYTWYTYAGEKVIPNEEFLNQLSDLEYDELIPCGYLYEDVMAAYENMGRISDTQKVLDDFVNGTIDAMCAVEEISDIPEDGFVMRSFDDLYEEIISGEEWWGNIEYIDFDNDGENELVMHGYARSKLFLDVIGGTVYMVLETYTTTDMGNVAEMGGQRVIERTDLLHAGRKHYRIMKYDSCGCLIDWFCLSVSYEGENYSENDVFEYRNKEISLEEFEEIVNSIHSL